MTLRSAAFCDRLGIQVPIVQAPVGSISTPELAAAVSNAGALGMIGVGGMPVGMVKARLRATAGLTGRPPDLGEHIRGRMTRSRPQTWHTPVCGDCSNQMTGSAPDGSRPSDNAHTRLARHEPRPSECENRERLEDEQQGPPRLD